MENLVPLPREEIFFDYTVRPLGAERIEVLLVSVPRDVINGYLAALDDAGVQAASIGLPSTALADYVTFCRGDVAARHGRRRAGRRRDRDRALLAGTPRREPARARAERVRAAPCSQRSLQRQLADELFEPEQTTLYRWSLVNGHAPAVTDRSARANLRRDGGRPARHRRRGVRARATPAILPAVGAALGAVREGVVAPEPAAGRAAGGVRRRAVDRDVGAARASVLLLVAWGARWRW